MQSTYAFVTGTAFNEREQEDLALAKSLLEHPGLAARLTQIVGAPIERGFKFLPPAWSGIVNRAVRVALWRALDIAVSSLDSPALNWSRKVPYKVLLGATGGVGGAFGVVALPFELPISTALMLRSIAEIARNEGFSLEDWSTRMACLEVFALAGPPARSKDVPSESSYWIVRSAMGKAVQDASVYLARRAAADAGAPVLVRLVETIAARFGAIISEQMAAKAVPLLGCVAGSAVNMLFMDHFQRVALGHFIVKRLEAQHGIPEVRDLYERLPCPKRVSLVE